MNTGRKIETERLYLLPGSNARDNDAFLQMLRTDGDFRMFCGVDLTDKYLNDFANYFERTGHQECIYSIFRKEKPDRFIGYVGFYKGINCETELEFYISKPYRNIGYCEEASRAAIKQLFTAGLSVDGKVLFVDQLFATTIADNAATIKVLEKVGFKRNIIENGPDYIIVFVDKKEDMLFENNIVQYVIKPKE